MKKFKNLFIVALFLLITFFAPEVAQASYAGVSFAPQLTSSVVIAKNSSAKAPAKVVKALQKVLGKYHSPLAPHAQDFADSAIKHGVDPFLVASIAGIESGFGKRYIPGTNNAWGWGGGKISFASWDIAIEKITAGLANKYITRGATTLTAINRIYCPPNQLWQNKVNFFRAKFYEELRRG